MSDPAPDIAAGLPAVPAKTTRKRVAIWAVVVVVAGVGAFFALRGPKNDLERLQGEWVIQLPREEGTEGGTSGPPLMVRVTGDRWAYVAGGQERSFFKVALNEAANPKEIELTRLTPDGQPASATNARGKQEAVVMRGVYAIDKTTAKVALAPAGQETPTSLDAAHPVVQTLTKK